MILEKSRIILASILLFAACSSPVSTKEEQEESVQVTENLVQEVEVENQTSDVTDQNSEESTKDTEAEEIAEVVTKISEKNLQEVFDTIPLEYCDEYARIAVLIYDEKNYYIKTGDGSPNGPSYSYCIFTIFKNTSGGNDIYGVQETTETPMYIFGGLKFLENRNNGWVEVTDELLAEVNFEDLKNRGAKSILENAPELESEGLEENYFIELPRYGTVLKFIHHNTKEVIYELKWNGEKFLTI